MARLLGTAPLAALLCAGTLAWPGGVAAQEPQRAGGETVDVELKIVPFYALDEKGKPVYDLRPEEVELRIDGRTVPLDSFDRSRRQAGEESHESLKGPGAVAAQIPAQGAYVWGVVAVEPASGAAYYKRLFIHDEQEAQPKGESR